MHYNLRKTVATVGLFLVFSFVLVLVAPAVKVETEPNTLVVPDDYATIQHAINSATPRDTVFVRKGIYNESLVISNKSIQLVGEDMNSTIVVGNGNTALVIQHDNVNVTGFTFKRPSTMRWHRGIHLLEVKNCNVYGNMITSTYYGIWCYNSMFNNVYENIVTGNMAGIILEISHNNTVTRNYVIGNDGQGIGTIGADNNTITENYVASNGWVGICLDGGSPNCNNLISANVVTQNTAVGISITSDGSAFNRIIGNNVTANGDLIAYNPSGTGILLNIHDNLVMDNYIIGNQAGIQLEYAYNNTVYRNLIANNTYGGIRDRFLSASQNIIYENNFINNTANFSQNVGVNVWDVNSKGNYWNNYNGTDSNNDGIGDTAHIIAENNTDYYPLMEPVQIPALEIPDTIPEFPLWLVLPLFFVVSLTVFVAKTKICHPI
ncbi:MAG: right-handed parallel beta-helix repeat-containing protein [Candidatus Bathyarchaeota archaeon]|nr:right-handed parallel beta-helix repeat-containing protein [Candidatus Bathyarchaeum sp.]